MLITIIFMEMVDIGYIRTRITYIFNLAPQIFKWFIMEFLL